MFTDDDVRAAVRTIFAEAQRRSRGVVVSSGETEAEAVTRPTARTNATAKRRIVRAEGSAR